MAKNRKINVTGTEITVVENNQQDYISLTDIAKHKTDDTSPVIGNWMRNLNTIESLGIWESLYNPDFKPLEFDGIRKQAGLNSFVLTAKRWIEATNAIGILSKAGRYGGTYTHKDIAFEFGSVVHRWLPPYTVALGNSPAIVKKHWRFGVFQLSVRLSVLSSA